MRRRLIVCAVIAAAGLLGATAATAQTISNAGAKIGIDFSSLPNAGDVLDQVVKHPSTETSSKTGVTFGGFVDIPFMDRLAVQPELNFVMKGVKLAQGPSGGTVTASLRYIEFPVLLRYGLTLGSHAGYVLVGPTFGVKAGTSGKLDTDGSSINLDPAIRTFDGGLAFAGGVDYERYVFEVRYTQGLSDIGADAYPHPNGIHNRVFSISAGYRLK